MKIKYMLFALMALASCSEDNQITEEGSGSDNRYNYQVKAPSFKVYDAAGDTRVDVIIRTEEVDYRWYYGDMIGIFPQKTNSTGDEFMGDQVYFTVNPINDSNNTQAFFDGGGWTVKKGYTYNAYYPFNEKDGYGQDMKHMPVDFSNQIITSSFTDKNIYMVANATAEVDNSLRFDFKPIISIGKCSVQMPDNDEGDIKKLTLEIIDETPHFVHKGTYDVSNPAAGIKASEQSNVFTMTIDEGGFHYSSANNLLDCVFTQAPLHNIKGKTCRASILYHSTIDGIDKTLYDEFTFAQDWEAGNVYNMHLYFNINVEKNEVILPVPGTLSLNFFE